MKAAVFDYIRADSLGHVLTLLNEGGADAKLIAGGQSLVPMMAMRFARPSLLIDINRLSDLKNIEERNGFIRIGACVRQVEVEVSKQISEGLPLLSKALKWVGHAQTRNRGTIGGSVAYADPSAELPLASAVLGASMHLESEGEGKRVVIADDFFLGPMSTSINETECLIGIDFPVWQGNRIGSAFLEVAMRKGDFAMASAACQLQLNADQSVSKISICLGGVDGFPKVFTRLAVQAIGQRLTSDLAKEIANSAGSECDPGGDIHVSAKFRRNLAIVLLERAMIEAAADAAKAG